MFKIRQLKPDRKKVEGSESIKTNINFNNKFNV